MIAASSTALAQTQLLAPTENGAELAYAIAVDGSDLATGAPGALQSSGTVFLYSCAGQQCSAGLGVVADDLQPGDLYGAALALSSDTLAIAAPGQEPGAVYIYVRNGSTWQLEQELSAATPAVGEGFGSSLALEGDRLVVGAPGADNKAGAVYVLERTLGVWNQTARLTAADANVGDALGYSVALSADTVLAGAPSRAANGTGNYAQGAAYVYVHSAGNWTQQSQLIPQFANNGAQFGFAVSLSDERALVGAPLASAQSGSAYVFQRTGQLWTQQAQLSSPGGIPRDRFGWSVAIDADRLLVGAPYAQLGCGQATQFARNGSSWDLLPTPPLPPTLGGLAGWSVHLSMGRSLVGMPGYSGAPSHQGAAYWRDPADGLFSGGFEDPAEIVCAAP